MPDPKAHPVDVVMTCYNSQSTIRSAVQSLLQQSFTRFRLIIVDDGSTDGTKDVLHELEQQDQRITVVHQEHAGIVAAANTGLDHCSAEFVARLDSDDIAFPQRLQRQVDHLRANPDCVAVSGAAYHIRPDGYRTGQIAHFDPPDKANPGEAPSREPYIMHPFVMVRRSALNAIGGYRYVDYAEDTDLYWRLQEIGRLDSMPEILGEYRLHNDSISSQSIINGRISAINSQLSGISAMRRRAGRPDIPFTADDLPQLRAKAELAPMLDMVAQRLDPAEARYHRFAVCAKLLELSTYRPYELEQSDCEFIRQTLAAGLHDLPPGSQIKVRALWIYCSARLLKKRLLPEVRALATRQLYVPILRNTVRQVLESLLPSDFVAARRHRRSVRATQRTRDELILISTSDFGPFHPPKAHR